MSNLLFLSGCYSKESYADFVLNSNGVIDQAANVLSWRVIQGLEENIPNNFQVLSVPFLKYYPNGYKKLVIKDGKWFEDNTFFLSQLGYINIKGIETWQKSNRIYRFIKRWYDENVNNRYILVYSHYAGFMRAIGRAKRKMPDLKISCIITDMPEAEHYNTNSLLQYVKSLPRNIMFMETYKNLKYISSFVVLSDKMLDILGKRNAPHIVMEGIADSKRQQGLVSQDKWQQIRLVYNGTLQKNSGVLLLVKAIELINNPLIELYISGNGELSRELENIGKENAQIHYMGMIPYKDVIQLQDSADILVNPRPNIGVTTSLFFPSKTMEYMAAGKLVMCFKLPCIPAEYDKYLVYFNSTNPYEMAEDIKKVIELTEEERLSAGAKGREFVSINKNPKVQVARILDLMDLSLGD